MVHVLTLRITTPFKQRLLDCGMHCLHLSVDSFKTELRTLLLKQGFKVDDDVYSGLILYFSALMSPPLLLCLCCISIVRRFVVILQ